jgi:hypothetical protein
MADAAQHPRPGAATPAAGRTAVQITFRFRHGTVERDVSVTVAADA